MVVMTIKTLYVRQLSFSFFDDDAIDSSNKEDHVEQ